MKINRKIIIVMMLFSCLASVGCNKKNEPSKPQNDNYFVKLPKLGEQVGINIKKSTESIYNIEKGKLNFLGNTANILELQYLKDKETYISLVGIKRGTELPQAIINISSGDKSLVIKDFYSAKNLRLSSKGSKLAFRTYTEDSISSADDVRIYDINGKRYNFDKEVLISGDLYKWLDDSNLLYYGVKKGEQGYGAIYKYDFATNTRTIIFDKFNGYCTNFFPLNSNEFIALENNMGQYSLFYYNFSNNMRIDVSSNFEKIFSVAIDTNIGNVYVIAKESNEENNSLYSVNLTKRNVNRLVYDFPQSIDENTDLILDQEGKVYFVGYAQASSDNDVFQYDYTNKSVNLISNQSGNYRLYSGAK
ncbi:MAG: hypothetical protein Q8936_01970 [Bacillota bacterium]|nr:hypothetical protein [Bacillota bacterium]